MNIYNKCRKLIFSVVVLLTVASAYGQKKAFYDVRKGNTIDEKRQEAVRDSSDRLKADIHLSGSSAAITGKDRVGTLGKMNSDYYDYSSGLQLSFPVVQGKLYFFGNETLDGGRTPSQYYVGSTETQHILSSSDADAITSFLNSRYGAAFDAGTAAEFVPRYHSKKFNNGIDWLINGANKLTLFSNITLSKSEYLNRDGQGFRFSSMAYDQVKNEIETGLQWSSAFSESLHADFSASYISIKDRRDPLGNANMPQVQIAGRTPGTLIFLGTDREASIYDSDQKVWTFDANIRWTFDEHDFLFGTQNELRDITFTYLSGWNGRIDYLSIEDFLNSNPYRVRGGYNYTNSSRQYILDNGGSDFNLNNFNVYIQDKIQVNKQLTVTPGLRANMVYLPTRPQLSDKVKDIWADPNFGTTYSYTPLNRIDNKFLNRVDLLPRIDIDFDLFADKSLIIRAGAGIFTGELPISWLAYAYRHTGDLYGDYSQRADDEPFSPNLDPLKPGQEGIADYIGQTGVILNNPNSGSTELDLIDNEFEMPKFFKTSLGIDYTVAGWKFGIEGMYQKTMKDILFQQVNVKDNPLWYGFDTEHRQPVYTGSVDPRFSSIYLMSNTKEGYQYYLKATVNKEFDFGLLFDAQYTYGESKDIKAGTNSSMEANRQLTASLIPNNPELAYSNSDIRHQIAAKVAYNMQWGKAGKTNVSLILDAKSGTPFTYGIVNHNIQGNSQYVSLIYIPTRDEAIRFFKDADGVTAQQQADAFNKFIDGDDYLKGKRGEFTERNAGRTPWNVRADLCLSHEFVTNKEKMQSLTVSMDVINLTNLLSKSWGKQYFTSETFNSTASVGLVPVLPFPQQNADNYPVYTFDEPGSPYSIDYFASRARLQFGIKYSF